MPGGQIRPLMVGSLITSSVGMVLLLATDFAGWEEEIEYVPSTIYRTYAINITSGYFIIIVALAAALLFAAYVSYNFLRSGDQPPDVMKLRMAFYGATSAAITSLIAGILFMVVLTVKDANDWWLDSGFYAGLIGGALTAIFLRLGLISVAKEL